MGEAEITIIVGYLLVGGFVAGVASGAGIDEPDGNTLTAIFILWPLAIAFLLGRFLARILP